MQIRSTILALYKLVCTYVCMYMYVLAGDLSQARSKGQNPKDRELGLGSWGGSSDPPPHQLVVYYVASIPQYSNRLMMYPRTCQTK